MDTCEHTIDLMKTFDGYMNEKYWAMNRPINIHFELTQRCNLRCVHCLFTHEVTDELATEEIISIIGQLRRLGVISLSLSGGELFTRRDVGDILTFLTKERFLLTLYTNGTLINSSLLDTVLALKPFRVEISVYGATPDVHDAVTNVPGSFQKTIHSMKNLSESGIPVIFKGFLLKQNYHQRYQMIKLARQMNVEYAFDFNLMPMENGSLENLAAGLSINQIRSIYDEVNNEELMLRNTVKIKSRDSQLPKGGNVICNPGRISGCISSTGDVYPCPTLRLPMGNLREQRFEEIWRTDKIDSLRYMRLEDLKSCSRCSILEYCNRCPGVAYLETGDYLGPSPNAVCRKYRALIEERKEG
jgi:radical SAM protein with 4Fe4S-binding SPASM domain